jgi:STE20-like kinase
MYGLFKSEEEKTMLVMEYVTLGSLDNFLYEKKDSLDLKELEWMCVHIARGMAYLHSSKILHNDLAARNVLLTLNDNTNEGKYLPKISDFGLAFHRTEAGDYIYKEGQIAPSLTLQL